MNRFLNRQKQLMLAMAGVLMLTVSCSQDVDNELGTTDAMGGKVGSEVKLQFTTNAVTTTRGTMYDNIGVMPEDSKFSVYGYSCKGGFDQMGNTLNFIANGEASKSGTVTVGGAAKYYNKAEPYVQLVGVYPYLQGENKLEKTGVDKYSLTYDLGANIDATQHKDLMVGKTNVVVQAEGEQQPAVITLHHALTAINFAIGDKCPTGYKIAGIEMQGLAAKGTCEVTFNGDMPTFNWTPSDTKENIRLKWPKYEGVGRYAVTPDKTTQVNRTQVTGVKTEDGKRDNLTIFMIPQQLGADAKAVIWLTKDTETFKGANPKKREDDHRANIKKLTINLAAVKAWKPGQVVVYRIDEELSDADLRYKFELRPSTTDAKRGGDGLSEATFNLNSYRYTFFGRVGKVYHDVYAALQSFQIVKYAYEDEAGMMHETGTNKLPDWITLSVTPKPIVTKPTYNMAIKVDHTKASYPASIKKLFITFKQDESETEECTMEITGLQPKAAN